MANSIIDHQLDQRDLNPYFPEYRRQQGLDYFKQWLSSSRGLIQFPHSVKDMLEYNKNEKADSSK